MVINKETAQISLLLTILFATVSFTAYSFMKDYKIATQEVGFRYKIELNTETINNKGEENNVSHDEKREAGISYSQLSHTI